MRIIAIFFVIFNHTGLNGFFLFTQRPAGSLTFWCYLFVSVFCKLSVPMFFCISGALMINKDKDTLSLLYRKRIFRVVVVLFISSCVYFLYMNYSQSGINIDLQSFFVRTYMGPIYYHLWYLYAYIAFLIGLPFIRTLARNLETKYFYYMILLALFFDGILPITEYVITKGSIGLSNMIKPSYLTINVVLYPCIGYFLDSRLDVCQLRNFLPKLWLVNILAIALSCMVTFYKVQITGILNDSDGCQTFHMSFVLLNCMTMFLTVKYFCSLVKWSEKVLNLVETVSGCVFGIYLIHVIVLDKSEKVYNLLKSLGVNSMLSSFVHCLIVFSISCVIIYLLRKLPIIKKYL